MMASREDKLRVLSRMAAAFNHADLSWAVGASLLLWFKGYVDDFHDVDLLVTVGDAEKMEGILRSMGSLQPSTRGSYATKRFREFTIDGVDVDMMGGYAIVRDGRVYDCELEPSQVAEYAEVYGERVPLHSVALWRRYYELMGRDEKVAIIDQKGI